MATAATLSFRAFSTASRRCLARNYSVISNGPSTNSIKTSDISRLFPRQHRWFASYPPHEVVGMPSLSPTMESGAIASWSLKEGEAFAPGDVLCSIETDKATVDFEAQDDGVVAKILQEGGTGTDIPCGQPILITVDDEDSVSAFQDYKVEEAAPAPEPPAPTPEPAAAGAPPPPPPTAAAAAPPSPPPASVPASDERVVASPLAHKLAKELGHSIAAIAGTGPGGRVIADDVREFVPMEGAAAAPTTAGTVAAPAAATVASPVPGSGFVDYPISASAAELAARLAQAKRNVPHYYLTVDITMDSLLELRSSINASLGDDATPLGTYEFLLKAAATAMKAVPSVNASWRESVVRVYDAVDINVAVGNGDALYTPVIRNVGTRGVQALSQDLTDALNAVTPRPPSEEEEDGDDAPELPANFMDMGTFTVMNLGMYGIKSCAPIVREPQSCALAFGTMENRIVPTSPEEDELYKQSVVMTATLSCDHRVVDGAVGAQWLSAFKSHVEHPHTLLL